jgi:hypothetical protein
VHTGQYNTRPVPKDRSKRLASDLQACIRARSSTDDRRRGGGGGGGGCRCTQAAPNSLAIVQCRRGCRQCIINSATTEYRPHNALGRKRSQELGRRAVRDLSAAVGASHSGQCSAVLHFFVTAKLYNHVGVVGNQVGANHQRCWKDCCLCNRQCSCECCRRGRCAACFVCARRQCAAQVVLCDMVLLTTDIVCWYHRATVRHRCTGCGTHRSSANRRSMPRVCARRASSRFDYRRNSRSVLWITFHSRASTRTMSSCKVQPRQTLYNSSGKVGQCNPSLC